MNIFSKYIPNKWITNNEEDPAWMTEEMENKIKHKNISYQQLTKDKLNISWLDYIDKITLEFSIFILQIKDDH